MTYIGIDQSLTGFAAAAINHNVVDYLRIVPKERGARRLYEIRNKFVRWLNSLGTIEHICMEGYANGSKFGREGMGEIGGLVKVTLLEFYGIDNRVSYPTIVQPLQLKKFAGNTKAKKDDLKLLVYKKWNVELLDDNILDAYVLAKIAQAMEESADLLYEQLVVNKLIDSNEWATPKIVRKRTSSNGTSSLTV